MIGTSQPLCARNSTENKIVVLGNAERAQWIFFFVLLLVLRLFAARGLQINSDEPQHLHVVWGWASGLLQYRDLFDNHSPLFQMLCAPLFRALGERADIIIPMRLAMIPLFAVCLWCVVRIGSALYPRRVAVWSAIFAGFCPVFFFKSSEFRTDDLWAALWLLALVILICRPLNSARAFCFGILVGMTFATSLKTVLLAASLTGGAVVVLGLRLFFRQRINWRALAVRASLALLGAIIVPGALVLYFVAHHALHEMVYCTVHYNIVPGLKRWGHFSRHVLWFPGSLPFLLAGAFFTFRFSADVRQAARRALILLATGFYITALYSYWPDITGEDMIPFVPLAALVIVPAVFTLFQIAATRAPALSKFAPALPALAAALEVFVLCRSRVPWHTNTRDGIHLIADVLRLTRPGEYVMDAKAGAIFRPRPFHYVMETVARSRMKAGLLVDDSPARMVATQTAVAVLNGLTPVAAEFVSKNYILISRRENLCVAGKMLSPSVPGGDEYAFELAVPLQYTITSENGAVEGTMDGVAMPHDLFLQPGNHVFRRTSGSGRIALFWARAAEQGFKPVFN